MGLVVQVEHRVPADSGLVALQPATVGHVDRVVVPVPGSDHRVVVEQLHREEDPLLLRVPQLAIMALVEVEIEPVLVDGVRRRVGHLPRPAERGVGDRRLPGVQLADVDDQVDLVLGQDVEVCQPVGLARLLEVDVLEGQVAVLGAVARRRGVGRRRRDVGLTGAVGDMGIPAVVGDEGVTAVLAFEPVAESAAQPQCAGRGRRGAGEGAGAPQLLIVGATSRTSTHPPRSVRTGPARRAARPRPRRRSRRPDAVPRPGRRTPPQLDVEKRIVYAAEVDNIASNTSHLAIFDTEAHPLSEIS